ncbi:dihydrodipicolinate synthase family protein [Caulobacter sp. UNC279MFTsu5.1]|uniref:dihydrodipicolinate synthase family protein n=1 Tax=Caulobacter sp. UNC279MFTsu5.1 TaxID=1502775 RepID=UPI0008E47E99|nr:dihydrodipicolinate synthase family protein [Caulobacter sp. UNC279MFTsu5.1]SFI56995.1 4-hydroxy-tetrahydrodipicolinate synthase [Caulobacter sp. UNC279MFTsu5.1]
MTQRLRGVIAAITTPVTAAHEPDLPRFVDRARHLLANGCDGLNVLGTTGEATSFSLTQRLSVMNAAADAGLPLSRMMVGTGAAAVADAVALSHEAGRLGFAGALVLPPFYYKPITDEGVVRVFDAIVEATAASAIPIYLYNFPALSGTLYSRDLVATLLTLFGERMAGLKDSSGDLAYASEIAALSPSFDVFPSNEGTLLSARGDGPYAGCISATANLNSPDCALTYRDGDQAALKRAVAVRALFDGLPLVPGIKALVAHTTGVADHGRTVAPLAPLTKEQWSLLKARFDALSVASPAA